MPYDYDFLDGGWTIRDRAGYMPDDEVSKATVFALANGYMGSRGAAELLSPQLPGVVGHYVNGLYDSPSGGILDREIVNLPAWTPLALDVDGEPLTLESAALQGYVRELDLRRGLLRQTFCWCTARGVTVTVESERLVSMLRLHLGALRWRIAADAACEVVVRSAVDAVVNNRFAANHFAQVNPAAAQDGGRVEITTIQEGYRACVAAVHEEMGVPGAAWITSTEERRVEAVCRFRLETGRSVSVTKFAAVYDSRFFPGDLAGNCRAELDGALGAGYDGIRAEHVARWESLWADSDVLIDGDAQAQAALRFCLFHLLANAPHSEDVSVSARGLQGQDYWGSIFWDCDVYVLPFFIYTQPKYARRSLAYRYHTLDGARRKAEGLGFRGAYYAWQSQETGDETCALYVFDHPLTGEKIRSYFADEQIHISADVAYAVWQYVRATGDEAFLADYGLEIICEAARFFASRVIYDRDRNRYELRCVLGPDEYHERVDNNTYTNAMARWTLQTALRALMRVREGNRAAYERVLAQIDLEEEEFAGWFTIAQGLYVPEPDPATGLIAQFDGYFGLEDAPPDVVKARLAHPDLHPGGPLGPFQATQAIKQADVVLLLYLLRDAYPQEVQRANWEYYEPRTAHDSSLSPMAYALVAAQIGKIDWAYRYFLHTAMMDLLGNGPHWNFGVHTAAMGGAWLAVVHGFCRLDLRDDGVYLCGWPTLPDGWRAVRFAFYWRGQRVRFACDGQAVTLETDGGPVPLHHPGGEAVLEAGQTATFRVEPEG